MIRTLTTITLLAGSLATAAVAAQDIFRWVDEEGVVHFSDTAPGAGPRGVTTVTIEDTRPSDYDPKADIYNVAAQAERMQALRDALQREREARRRQRRDAAPQAPVRSVQPVGYALPPWWLDEPGRWRSRGRGQTERPPAPEDTPSATLRPPGQTQD